jgi:hypothetical protein
MAKDDDLAASLMKLATKTLREMLARKGRQCKGCTQKEDFVEELMKGDGVQVTKPVATRR